MAFDAYTADLRCLVEHASRKNGGKPVIPQRQPDGRGVPHAERDTVVQEVRQAPRHGLHRRRRHRRGDAEPRRLRLRSAGVAGEDGAELRDGVRSAAVPERVRRRAAGGDAAQELLGPRHLGVPPGGQVLRRGGQAVPHEGAAGELGVEGAARDDDRRLRRQRADAGATGVLGRRLQQGAGGGVRRRRRRRSSQSGERVGVEHSGRT
ncbi:Os10g0163201 [Oryza sativa Japonica Group]|uniref:Os10g0163201 protein n=1 Tax=Oryza sativa subsp. japonica TaxID=39947 RepID=C7J7A0_ORYSJ|nr:Os10g0163201 [Oryza sativa Japonica Group]|eukprot:NP_001176039.1 Os10g0163201 [Oryza sativa Japonica Group]